MPAQLLRHAEKAVIAALQDTRVVLVNGARQAGKSTLVKKVLKTHERARWRTLDDGVTLGAARADPLRFVQHDDLLAIVYPLHEPHLPCLSAMVNMATHGRCGDVVEASG